MRHLVVMAVLALPLLGQSLPDAPGQQFLARTPAVELPTHPFFQHGNRVRMAIVGGLIAADGITTQHIVNTDHGSELNPVVRPLVKKGAAGQVGASLLGYSLSVGSSYLLHRTGHHKLERFMLNASIAVEAECVTSNLVQIGLGPH